MEFITNKIGELTDRVILPLFDRLRPFAAHNQAMRELLEALNNPSALADPIQAKCRSLLFDGTGNRHVFDEHVDRLKEDVVELSVKGQPVPAHLTTQLNYCDAVSRALSEREDSAKLQRSFLLFNIDVPNFLNRDKAIVDADLKVVRVRGRAIFDALSTQAFQLGYLMAILSHVEILLPTAVSYDDRLATTKFISALYLAGLNCFFSDTVARHRTLSGYVVEPRACSFEAGEAGFCGLLAATNVRELNEKQWEFFRYMILEVVHSRMASAAVVQVLNAPDHAAHAARFRSALPTVTMEIDALRNRYFEAAVRTALGTPDFRREVDMLEMQARANGKSDDDVKLLVDAAVAAKRTETIEICKGHLKASLGRLDSPAQIIQRLGPSVGASTGLEGSNNSEIEPTDNAARTVLQVAVDADSLHHQTDEDEQTE